MSLTISDFFRDRPESRQLFDALMRLIDEIGSPELVVTRSQIAMRRARPFAWVWIPGRYLHGRRVAPLVLSLVFAQRDPSPRWKEIVEPARGRFMHHLELFSETDLNDEVRIWLRKAWAQAG